MKTLLAVTFAKALSELPAEKVRNCWFGLQKAFPSDNADHEELLQEAKANRARLFEGGEGGGAPEPTEDEVEPDPEPGPEADIEPDDAEPLQRVRRVLQLDSGHALRGRCVSMHGGWGGVAVPFLSLVIRGCV
eukprot:scaffold263_cov51-Phaeocystis_antarctica.AAC.2